MNASRYWRMARNDPGWFAQRLREEAEVRTAVAQRRIRRETDEAVRVAVARSGLAKVVTSGPSAEVSYFAVLDGRTLNLHARLPEAVDGAAELVFARAGRRLHAPVDPVVAGELTATVPLGEAAGGVRLTRGGWRIGVRVRTATGERAFTLLGGARVLGAWDGPTALTPPCPLSGMRFVPETSATGMSLLRVADPEPSAEIVGLDLTFARITVDFALVGTSAAARAAVRFQARGKAGGSAPAHTVAATPVGRPGARGPVFRVTVPLRQMATGSGSGGERLWHLFAEPPGERPLRLGRRLHDVRDPRRALPVAQRMLAVSPAALVRVRPYYTGSGDLVLACAPVPAGAPAFPETSS
ncbi:hypothetical protein DZF91_36980 [Actinomadura logoneensis]|uniref:Uncharacterized protein n=1 Tax=Actinomadura logoneensis TaxID=2293572 RepID=A0A372JA04_9ACTN|nr:hypothetical protein [Actinomadura logoneensis]RFU36644.1 hypothetical protein DZF91_36980 [Actinomadura logoneensis]